MERAFLLLLGTFLGLSAFAKTSVIRRAADLADALRDNGPTDRTFDLTATVAYVSTNCADEKTNVAVQDLSGAVLFRAESRHWMRDIPAPGVLARCTGNITNDVYGRRFAALTGYVAQATGSVPRPTELTRSELFDRQHNFMLSRISGTLRDVVYNDTDPYWLILSICNDDGKFIATVPISDNAAFTRLHDLIGLPISAVGICVPYDHSPRLQTGRFFKIAATDDIRIRDASIIGDKDIPSIESLRSTQLLSPANLGRHRASGTVVAAWQGNHSLIRTDSGDFIGLEFARLNRLPAYGDRIMATGIPETDLFRISLLNATWEALPRSPMSVEIPAEISPKTLLTDGNGRRRVNCEYHGHAVRIRGIVRSLPDDNADARTYVECDGCQVPVDSSAHPSAMGNVSVGCEIEVSGTCVLDVIAPKIDSAIPRLLGFTIVIRSPHDVKIVSRPSWWTSGRLLVLIGTLTAALLAIVIWNTSLRRLAEKRGKELAQSAIARATSDLKVYERTRLAVELHDSLAQNLTGVSLEIDTADKLSDADPKAMHEHLTTASKALKSCRNELRNCLWDLRHQTLESGDMETAIRQTLTPHLGAASLTVRFRVPRERISDNTAHAILRIVRELTVNAVRHGKATVIKVAGSIDGDQLRFSVRDNGIGFDPRNCPGDEQGHYGLLGIRERVNTFEGVFQISSTPGAGTKAMISLHIPQETA